MIHYLKAVKTVNTSLGMIKLRKYTLYRYNIKSCGFVLIFLGIWLALHFRDIWLDVGVEGPVQHPVEDNKSYTPAAKRCTWSQLH